MTLADDGALSETVALLRRGMEASRHFGAQVSVRLPGDRHLQVVLGDGREGVPMTPDFLMPLYCAARPLLVLALARLSVTSGLDFDEPVTAYVPEFGQCGKQAVTIRHLLLHTSGFSADPVVELRGESWETNVAAICAAPLHPGWAPGAEAAYQKLSYWYIVGEVVMRAAAEPLDTFLRCEILEPLGLFNTWVGMPESQYLRVLGRLGHVSQIYSADSIVPLELETSHFCCSYLPFSPRGTMADLSRLYQFMLDPAGHGRLLPPSLVRSLTAPARVGLIDRTWTSVGNPIDWSLFSMVESRRNDRTAQLFGRHSSDLAFGHYGMHVTVGFGDPVNGVAAAYSINSMLPPLSRVMRTQAICTAIFQDVARLRAAR